MTPRHLLLPLEAGLHQRPEPRPVDRLGQLSDLHRELRRRARLANLAPPELARRVALPGELLQHWRRARYLRGPRIIGSV